MGFPPKETFCSIVLLDNENEAFEFTWPRLSYLKFYNCPV